MTSASPRRAPHTLALLSALYFVQGMPFGFVTGALSLYLLERKVDAKALGFLGALFAPYYLKALWAPLVDRYGSARLGRRRTWLLPLQLLLCLTCFGASFAARGASLGVVLGLVLLMNLWAAAQDVAVDGLAVDLLGPQELGGGNAAQVAGYKLGSWMVGGLLVWQLDRVGGWPGLFRAMALFALLAFPAVLLFREPPPRAALEEPVPGKTPWRTRMGEVLALLGRALRVPGAGWLLAFIGSYKFGEYMLDVYFRAFLKEAGVRTTDIGLWVGTLGNGVSVLGSLAGGLLVTRLGPWRAVSLTAVLRVLPVAAEWALTHVGPTPERVLAVTLAENLVGGALTTAVFALMMSRVDVRVGASHYTVLATVELVGKMPGGPVAGLLRASGWSYSAIFALGTLICVAVLALLPPLRRTEPQRGAAPAPLSG
ncbi:MFS transporter [Aggregicoccus sp. 17bor-14]|uniref:MFS transporter n=1 Tax=Myxococcaceae TaxID=31 RepID=UPI00129C86CE|nr:MULTISPECIES: MFS transporter [Myxococcaceae]MBF5043859.1 MFS transporter [Simulacricoccus sp. 17bor-14]MRI89611.1 MFS transporter [Aggregicoccus sp. 17bor-14]